MYKHILVPIDDSPLATAAVEHALDLAQVFKSTVTIMSVVAIDPFVGVDFYKVAPSVTDHLLEAESNAQSHLDRVKFMFEELGIEVNTKILHEEKPAVGILNIADEVNADIIVMGSHGRSGIKKILLGSVAQQVMVNSHIPVMVVKSKEE